MCIGLSPQAESLGSDLGRTLFYLWRQVSCITTIPLQVQKSDVFFLGMMVDSAIDIMLRRIFYRITLRHIPGAAQLTCKNNDIYMFKTVALACPACACFLDERLQQSGAVQHQRAFRDLQA